MRKCKAVNLALFHLGDSPASEFYLPMVRNALIDLPVSSEEEEILPCVCVRYPVYCLYMFIVVYWIHVHNEDIITHDRIPRILIFCI
jgi:hypothetical protein